MKIEFLKLKEASFDCQKNYVIYGAGDAGRAIEWYLTNVSKVDSFCFWDSNPSLHNSDAKHPILMPGEAINPDVQYIIGFIENNEKKILSVYEMLCLLGVKDKNIIVIDLSLKEYKRIQYTYIEYYIKSCLEQKKEKERIKSVEQIAFLANGYTQKTEKGGCGGPIGAICMQKKHLGNQFNDIPIIYPYYKEGYVANRLIDKFAFIWSPINQTKDIVKRIQKDTIFVVNDIFSAFALAIKGKNYCLIYHGQGDIVQELSNWGEEFTDEEKELVWFIEKVAIQCAYKCCFPSCGAYLYFINEFGLDLNCTLNNPLYNTLYDNVIPEVIEGILKDETKITFLSVGQMTWLKGMDRIPLYLEAWSKKISKKIRWIVVANGILKDEISKKIEEVNRRIENKVEYVNIDYRLSHQEVFYLMDISDVYIMLHRVSIFDFSTLEAMYHGKAVILSNVPGNDEFNKEQNVMLIDENTDTNLIKEYIKEKDKFGKLNKQVYDKYFSEREFINRYKELLNQFIHDIEVK